MSHDPFDDDDGTAADDMLDGTCCQICGEFFDDVIDGEEPPGVPRTCSACESDLGGKVRKRRSR